MKNHTHAISTLLHRSRTMIGLGGLILAVTVAAGCGSGDSSATITAATIESAPTTAAPVTAAPVTAAPTTSAATEAPTTTAAVDAADDDVDGDTSEPIVASEGDPDELDWISADDKVAMKIQPYWVETGNAPSTNFLNTLEEEWNLGPAADEVDPIVSVYTSSAGDATLDQLPEDFWMTHKGVEYSYNEVVTNDDGKQRLYFETTNLPYHTMGFVTIENGILAEASVTTGDSAFASITEVVGPYLATITVK